MWKNDKENDRGRRRIRGRKRRERERERRKKGSKREMKIEHLMHPEESHPVSMREGFLWR